MAITRPDTIPTVWASGETGIYLNYPIPQTGSGAGGVANWFLGFPPQTFGLGSIPPAGGDMNGVLNILSANLRWVNLGRAPIIDATLSTALGGYSAGSVIELDGLYGYVVSTVDNNTFNPNSGPAGNWAGFGGTLALSGNFSRAVTGTADAIVMNPVLPITTSRSGTRILFLAASTNTSAVTLDAGNGVVNLVNNANGPLAAGDIIAGSYYEAVYDSTWPAWLLTAPVPSQAGSTLFTGCHDVSGSRALGGGPYTNSTNKPMFVSVSVVNGGAAANLSGVVNGTTVVEQGQAAASALYAISFMVPAGATYTASVSSGGTIAFWTETY